MNNDKIFKHYKSKKTSKEIEYEIRSKFHIKPLKINREMTQYNFELKNLYFEWRRKKYEESIHGRY